MIPAVLPAVDLREPEHRVSPRAVSYWRLTAAVEDAVVCGVAATAYVVVPQRPWWAGVLLGLLVATAVVHVAVMPGLRYRVHRWEATPVAVHTRSGWIGRETRIAPLSRVQTVDSKQGPVMRLFGLASLTVTTASAAGPITIDCLDAAEARRLVAALTEVTAASEGDAT